MTIETGIISGVSVSHRNADVETIEAACADSQRTSVETLLENPGVSEAFVLQTCNRSEAYVIADDEATGREALERHAGGVDDEAIDYLGHEESLKHLMRVACGLESLVIGEDQIIGQVRTAYEDARAVGGIGTTLDDALLKAIHVGERAREGTAINEGVVSLGSAAVRLAAGELELDRSTALVVGAGEMSTLAARSLDGSVERIVVANRTVSRAEHIISELDTPATAVDLEALSSVADTTDLLITATGSDAPVVDSDTLADAGETLVIDLAQPRDVAPAADSLAGIDVRDLDALESVTEETHRQRREAAEAVETMIDEEFEHLISQYKRKRADQVISAMYEGAERTKAGELQTAFSKLEAEGEFTDEQREIVESMADALVGQLLSAPTRSLRDAAENDDWSTINTALQLFDPGFRPDPADMPSIPNAAPEGVPEEISQEMSARPPEQPADSED